MGFRTKIIIAIGLIICVIAVLAGVKGMQFKTMIDRGKSFAPPPETVSTVEARNESWQGTLSAIGSIRAAQGVDVTTELPGTIREISFESGAAVEEGAVLVRLDVSTEEAQLRSVDAQFNLARINLERVEKLRADNTVSEAELDTARSTLNQFKANADAIRAAIEKKTIRAPFAGLLGIRLVNLGQYLEAGKPIVSLQSLTPVFADFSLPQQELRRLQTGMPVHVGTDTYPDKVFEGTLTAINPDLDEVTRSVPLRATFENKERLLRPGMFAKVAVLLPEQQDMVIIPSTSVLSAPFGDSVFVVEQGTNSNLVVRQQFIKTGPARGDFVSVMNGLKSGEKIVSSGVFKLRNGLPVVENNSLVPPISTKPRPSDT
jgi:membrane fusion protein (multidrug efflux system)